MSNKMSVSEQVEASMKQLESAPKPNLSNKGGVDYAGAIRKLGYTDEDFAVLLRSRIPENAPISEVYAFLKRAKVLGLNPLSDHIRMFERKGDDKGKKKYSILTSIDGARILAQRTGRYAPGKKVEYEVDSAGELVSATVNVLVLHEPTGAWHETPGTAFYEEYVQNYYDAATGTYKPTHYWNKMPRHMLAKCAEMIALRRGFPEIFADIYTEDEIQGSHETPEDVVKASKAGKSITKKMEEVIEGKS